MEPESFFHVAVKIDDLAASEAFYREQFGGQVVDRGDAAGGSGATAVNHVALEVADKLVYLFDEAPYEAAGLVESVPTGFLHFGYVVPDVVAAAEELAAAGVEFLMEPTTFGDLKLTFLTDPSGVRIELIEHL
jgi:catechol 2,3-dioxygenase-like lactoylglutathione lyase family enzyme